VKNAVSNLKDKKANMNFKFTEGTATLASNCIRVEFNSGSIVEYVPPLVFPPKPQLSAKDIFEKWEQSEDKRTFFYSQIFGLPYKRIK